MTHTRPTLFHRSLRWLGVRLQGLKGVDSILRQLHPPGPQGRTRLRTESAALWDGPRFHVDTCSYLEWLLFFYGSQNRPIHRWIREHVKRDWVCMDVGMNFGFVTCLCAQTGGEVHSFEPVDMLAERAQSNCALNGFTNVAINRAVLSDFEGEMEFSLPARETGNLGTGSLVHHQDSGTIRVHSTTVDNYSCRQKWKRLNFIKIDVEGAEALVLRGALKTLTTLRPAIIFEKNADSGAECQRILEGCGYQLADLEGNSFCQSMWTDPHCADLLATPE